MNACRSQKGLAAADSRPANAVHPRRAADGLYLDSRAFDRQLFNEREKARKVRLESSARTNRSSRASCSQRYTSCGALEIKELTDRRIAKDELAEGLVDVIVFIGPGYHERIEELDLGDLFYADDGRLSGKLRSLDIHVEAGSFLAMRADRAGVGVRLCAQTIAPDVLKRNDSKLATQLFLKAKRAAAERADELSPDEPIEGHAPQTRASIVYQILVPSYTVMFVFFIVNFMARSFITEAAIGTLNRLRIAPVTRIGLMLGKTIPFLLISLLQTVLLFRGRAPAVSACRGEPSRGG